MCTSIRGSHGSFLRPQSFPKFVSKDYGQSKTQGHAASTRNEVELG